MPTAGSGTLVGNDPNEPLKTFDSHIREEKVMVAGYFGWLSSK